MILNSVKEKFNIKIFSLQAVQLIRTGTVFLVSVFLAKVYRNTEFISQYETLSLVATALTYFWVSGIMTTFLPFYHHSDTSRQKTIIFNTFISLSAISIISALLMYLIGLLLFNSISNYLFLAFAVFILFNSPVFLIEYIYLVKNKNKKLILYSIISFSFQIIALCLPLYLGTSLLSALVYLDIFAIMRFIFLIILVRKYASFNFDKEILHAHLKKSTPIMLSLLIGGSTEVVNGFVVRYFSSNHDFAIFRYGAREFPLVRLLANAMSIVISGEIASAVLNGKMDETLAKLKSASLRLMHILFPLTILLLFFSKPLFRLLYTDVFTESYKIFNIYLLLIVSRLFFPQTILMGLQKNSKIMEASIAEFAVNAFLAIVLVQFFGIVGVPFATLTAYYLNQFLLYVTVRKNGIKLSQYTPVKTWLTYSAICWVVFLFL